MAVLGAMPGRRAEVPVYEGVPEGITRSATVRRAVRREGEALSA